MFEFSVGFYGTCSNRRLVRIMDSFRVIAHWEINKLTYVFTIKGPLEQY